LIFQFWRSPPVNSLSSPLLIGNCVSSSSNRICPVFAFPLLSVETLIQVVISPEMLLPLPRKEGSFTALPRRFLSLVVRAPPLLRSLSFKSLFTSRPCDRYSSFLFLFSFAPKEGISDGRSCCDPFLSYLSTNRGSVAACGYVALPLLLSCSLPRIHSSVIASGPRLSFFTLPNPQAVFLFPSTRLSQGPKPRDPSDKGESSSIRCTHSAVTPDMSS